MGIEPTRPAWKAGILPLNYTRIVFLMPLEQVLAYYIIFDSVCQYIFLNFFQKNFPLDIDSQMIL